jgi:hypothetical protein
VLPWQVLSRKFVILYKLCEDLLSKARHYDWKLRAIKTTLYVAGGMKRAAPELSEEKVRSKRYGKMWSRFTLKGFRSASSSKMPFKPEPEAEQTKCVHFCDDR